MHTQFLVEHRLAGPPKDQERDQGRDILLGSFGAVTRYLYIYIYTFYTHVYYSVA